MQTERRRLLPLGAACAVSALSGIIGMAVTGSGLIGLGSFAAAIYLSFVIATCGWRGTLVAGLLLTALPSVLGESSALLSFAGMVGAFVVLLTARSDGSKQVGGVLLIGLLFITLSAAMVVVGGGQLPLVYAGAGAVAALMIGRPAVALSALKALAFTLAPLVLSYAITLATGFSGRLVTTLEIGSRDIEVYLPFTLATSGPPFIPNSRRMTLLVGEPGLAVFFLAPLLAVLLMSSASRWWKLVGIAAIGVAALFGQSFAAIVALAAMLGTYAAVVLAVRRRHPLLATIGSGAALAIALPLIYESLVLKAGVAAESVTDRGVLNAGGASAASLGNINLIVAWSNNQILALLLGGALVLAAALTVRSAETAGLWVAFAVTAVFAQPSQWQVGAWVLLVLVSAVDRRRRPSGPTQAASATSRARGGRGVPALSS